MDQAPVFIIASRHAARQRFGERLFKGATLTAAVLVLLLLGGVTIALIKGAWPALSHFKLEFLTRQVWNPVTEKFGALAPIYGTVVTSVIAMVVAIPLSFGIAVFLTELCPAWLKRPVGTAVELLAAVPSIIFGIWGMFVFAPVLQRHVQPWLIEHLGPLPGIGALFQGPPYGIGILTASLVLAIMVLPYIASVMRDVFETVPDVLRESAYGLGATTWEVIWNVVLPYSTYRRRRRHHAGAGTGAGRNHGRHLRDRQRAPHQQFGAGPRYDDLRHDCQ